MWNFNFGLTIISYLGSLVFSVHKLALLPVFMGNIYTSLYFIWGLFGIAHITLDCNDNETDNHAA